MNVRYRLAETVVWNHLRDEIAVLDTASEQYYGLDAVGAWLWPHLAQPRSLSDLVDLVCSRFDVTPATCRHDLEVLIDDLLARGLIERLP
ncbi:MAG: PqqD family protein [Planctomycetota bacterium]|jgi:hypothetical protein